MRQKRNPLPIVLCPLFVCTNLTKNQRKRMGQFILGNKTQAIAFSNSEENRRSFIDMLALGFEKVPID